VYVAMAGERDAWNKKPMEVMRRLKAWRADATGSEADSLSRTEEVAGSGHLLAPVAAVVGVSGLGAGGGGDGPCVPLGGQEEGGEEGEGEQWGEGGAGMSAGLRVLLSVMREHWECVWVQRHGCALFSILRPLEFVRSHSNLRVASAEQGSGGGWGNRGVAVRVVEALLRALGRHVGDEAVQVRLGFRV
jgi:hypothetical protein